jgi:dTDP-4-dehydrorhamnose reductase
MASSPLRVLVTGASGYLGQFLLDEIIKNNLTVDGRQVALAGAYSTRNSIPEGAQAVYLNLQDASSVEGCVSEFNPDVVINLAALSSPAACEKSKAEAEALNNPRVLLDSLARINADALFIQVSTDQIFDGNNAVYSEQSAALPVNTYGATKLMFEEELRGRWPNHVILRSSLIYGPAPPRACSRKDTFLQVFGLRFEEHNTYECI